jgi:hypothetical protein
MTLEDLTHPFQVVLRLREVILQCLLKIGVVRLFNHLWKCAGQLRFQGSSFLQFGDIHFFETVDLHLFSPFLRSPVKLVSGTYTKNAPLAERVPELGRGSGPKCAKRRFLVPQQGQDGQEMAHLAPHGSLKP